MQAELPKGEYWPVPDRYHNEIRQDLVVMKHADAAADQFIQYLDLPQTRALIRASGYKLPEEHRDRE